MIRHHLPSYVGLGITRAEAEKLSHVLDHWILHLIDKFFAKPVHLSQILVEDEAAVDLEGKYHSL